MRFVVLLLTSSVFGAAANNQWTMLFDGKSLDGWKADGNPGTWTVKDGSIHGEGSDGRLVFLSQKCVNCEFRADVRIAHGPPPFMIVRSAAQGGYQAQADCLRDFETPIHTTSPGDGWWTEDLIVEGNHVQILVNGKKTVDFIDEQNTYTTGGLALALAGGGVADFKNVEMRDLPAPGTPLAGTWRLKDDQAKAGAPSELRILEERNGIRFRSNTGVTYFARADGYDYRVNGSPSYDHVSIQRTDRHYVHEALKTAKIGKKDDPRMFLVQTSKGRKPVSRSAYSVSVDGKTLTIEGTSKQDGAPEVHSTETYERVE